MRITILRLALAISTGLLNPWLAWAQKSPTADTLPRTDIQLLQQRNVQIEIQPPSPKPENVAAKRLTPTRFQIEGVRTLPFPEVAAYFSPMTGRSITVAQLLAAAKNITQLYVDRGYPLSFAFVPAQTFEGGKVRITVVEGYVARIRIEGSPGPLEARLRALSEPLINERPLRREAFDRMTGVLALQPGVQISATVPPPTVTDGASELTLHVKRSLVSTSSTGEVSSSHAYRTPGLRTVITGTLNSVTPWGEQITVSTLQPRGPNDETYYTATWTQPIGVDGMLGSLTWSRYRGMPEDMSLSSNGYLNRYLSETDRLGLSLSYPALLSSARSLMLTGTLYGNDELQRYTLANTGALTTQSAKVRVLGAEAAYTESSPGQTRRASIGLYQGISNAGAAKSFGNKVDLSYLRTRLSISEARDLPGGFGLMISGVAQYSGAVLASSEKIGFGGRFFGLGYPAGEISGDRGWGTSLEISYPFPVPLPYLKIAQPYALFDSAKVYSNGYTVLHDQLSSIALGMRFSDRKIYSLDLAIAKPAGQIPANATSRSLRFNAAYTYQFP